MGPKPNATNRSKRATTRPHADEHAPFVPPTAQLPHSARHKNAPRLKPGIGKTQDPEKHAFRNRNSIEEKHEPTPAIIPPMLGKMSTSPAIAAQWRAAIRILSEAAHIVVIGYSFPETDTFMSRLLAAGLKDSGGLEGVRIVDIQTEEDWCERLTRIFTPTLRDYLRTATPCSGDGSGGTRGEHRPTGLGRGN